jgi:two-component system CheB/CheR fusion protein
VRAEEELSARMKEIGEFNRMAVGRELRMIELKEEINRLLVERGMEEKYEVGA